MQTGECSLLARQHSPGMCNAVFIGIENESILTCELMFEISCDGLVMAENVWGNRECFGVTESLGQDEREWETSTPPLAQDTLSISHIQGYNAQH